MTSYLFGFPNANKNRPCHAFYQRFEYGNNFASAACCAGPIKKNKAAKNGNHYILFQLSTAGFLNSRAFLFIPSLST